MARIFKAVLYIVDANDVYSCKENVLTDIGNSLYDGYVGYSEISDSGYFEFDDNLPINMKDCKKSEFENYFS